MKTILAYTLRVNASYNGLFHSLLREGRRRGWCFAWIEPDESVPQTAERARLSRIFQTLRPDGFVGGYLKRNAPVRPPRGIPAVWVDTSRVPPGAWVVRHDNASFGRAAAEALVADGERFAAFGLKRHQWSAIRERAFAERIRESGKPCRSVRFDAESHHPYASIGAIRTALLGLERPVSVFAVSDKLAAAVLMAASSLGWRSPKDLRLVGVDDDELLCMSFPTPISSVHPDWMLGGRLVAEALEAQMLGEREGREVTYGASGVTRRATTRVPLARPRDARVETALAFIAAEFASPVSMGDVAAAMGCSRSLAALRFREETGKTILQALEDARWERLCVLLRRKDADLSALSGLCGFRSASALRQFFRRRTGLSMTEWRKRERL